MNLDLIKVNDKQNPIPVLKFGSSNIMIGSIVEDNDDSGIGNTLLLSVKTDSTPPATPAGLCVEKLEALHLVALYFPDAQSVQPLINLLQKFQKQLS
ncbi:hypothetical protein [Runella zeae]|uniref:hypothetical protein n=1 Tax=Runella zeae TaxID=94255 RepID=UPI00041F9AA9|nr:hypothetical protein [Runella zeae]